MRYLHTEVARARGFKGGGEWGRREGGRGIRGYGGKVGDVEEKGGRGRGGEKGKGVE